MTPEERKALMDRLWRSLNSFNFEPEFGLLDIQVGTSSTGDLNIGDLESLAEPDTAANISLRQPRGRVLDPHPPSVATEFFEEYLGKTVQGLRRNGVIVDDVLFAAIGDYLLTNLLASVDTPTPVQDVAKEESDADYQVRLAEWKADLQKIGKERPPLALQDVDPQDAAFYGLKYISSQVLEAAYAEADFQMKSALDVATWFGPTPTRSLQLKAIGHAAYQNGDISLAALKALLDPQGVHTGEALEEAAVFSAGEIDSLGVIDYLPEMLRSGIGDQGSRGDIGALWKKQAQDPNNQQVQQILDNIPTSQTRAQDRQDRANAEAFGAKVGDPKEAVSTFLKGKLGMIEDPDNKAQKNLIDKFQNIVDTAFRQGTLGREADTDNTYAVALDIYESMFRQIPDLETFEGMVAQEQVRIDYDYATSRKGFNEQFQEYLANNPNINRDFISEQALADIKEMSLKGGGFHKSGARFFLETNYDDFVESKKINDRAIAAATPDGATAAANQVMHSMGISKDRLRPEDFFQLEQAATAFGGNTDRIKGWLSSNIEAFDRAKVNEALAEGGEDSIERVLESMGIGFSTANDPFQQALRGNIIPQIAPTFAQRAAQDPYNFNPTDFFNQAFGDFGITPSGQLAEFSEAQKANQPLTAAEQREAWAAQFPGQAASTMAVGSQAYGTSGAENISPVDAIPGRKFPGEQEGVLGYDEQGEPILELDLNKQVRKLGELGTAGKTFTGITNQPPSFGSLPPSMPGFGDPNEPLSPEALNYLIETGRYNPVNRAVANEEWVKALEAIAESPEELDYLISQAPQLQTGFQEAERAKKASFNLAANVAGVSFQAQLDELKKKEMGTWLTGLSGGQALGLHAELPEDSTLKGLPTGTLDSLEGIQAQKKALERILGQGPNQPNLVTAEIAENFGTFKPVNFSEHIAGQTESLKRGFKASNFGKQYYDRIQRNALTRSGATRNTRRRARV